MSNIRLNRDNLLIIAKTRDSNKIPEMGLARNRAAFRITPIEKEKDHYEIFRVDTTVPQKWVGELSVIAD